MANPSGRKGAQWEIDSALYLQEHGFPLAERRVKSGRFDRGDMGGVRNYVLEAKAEVVIDLPGYLRELAVERENAKALFGAVWIKNRRHGIEDGYAVRSIRDEVHLLNLLAKKGLLDLEVPW